MTSPGADAGSLAAVRRRDRSRDDAWIAAFLEAAPAGVLATVEDGRAFLNPNLFAYDAETHALFVHTARVGRTRSVVEEGGRSAAAGEARDGVPVTFVAWSMGRLLPADTALEFSVEYASVVVFGRARLLEDPGEAGAALQRILDRYAPHLRPGRDYRPIQLEELRRTSVFRVAIEEWSGKQKAVDATFPGAYRLPQVELPFEAPGTADPDAHHPPSGDVPLPDPAPP